MSRYQSYLNTASRILKAYKGNEPFTHHIRTFFSAEKRYGSTDRKFISGLCYSYFRSGHAVTGSVEEKIIAAHFICEQAPTKFLEHLAPQLNELVSLAIDVKFDAAKAHPEKLFPFISHLSDQLDPVAYSRSMLVQPDLFLRGRPGKVNIVGRKLNDTLVDFELLNDSFFRLKNNTRADMVVQINREAVVQDFNSGQVLNYLLTHPLKQDIPEVWDCCAASGGKSILIYDILKGNLKLTVSDIRETILRNLKERLAQARVPVYHSFVADLTSSSETINRFPLIICDAPCSGSGTWSRTPEQLTIFSADKIRDYASLQKQIVSNTLAALQPGGLYFYITCSVFKEENESNVDYFIKQFPVKLLHAEYLSGYHMKADTLYVAVFTLLK